MAAGRALSGTRPNEHESEETQRSVRQATEEAIKEQRRSETAAEPGKHDRLRGAARASDDANEIGEAEVEQFLFRSIEVADPPRRKDEPIHLAAKKRAGTESNGHFRPSASPMTSRRDQGGEQG